MMADFTKHENPIPYFTSPLLDSYGVKHCFTTRFGGVSAGVFESLNFARGDGDARDSFENIYRNYEIAAAVTGMRAADVCRVTQRHTDKIETVTLAHRGYGLSQPTFPHGADGLVTQTPGVVLSVRYADCVPVLLYDAKANIAAAAHSGWRGAEKKIVKNALSALRALGGKSQDTLAALGPCVKPCCYDVAAEFDEHFIDFPHAFSRRGGKTYFNLAAVVAETLATCGVNRENIQICSLCTCCAEENGEKLFFSHRRQGRERGTMSAFISAG